MHSHNEPHKTATFGTIDATPRLRFAVLRMGAKRANIDDAERSRLVTVLEKWLERRADRHGFSFANLQIGAIGGNEGSTPDGLAVIWFEIDTFPEDWLCFSGMAWDVYTATTRSAALRGLVDLSSLFEGGHEEQGDIAEAKVGTKTMTIGTQKHRTDH